MAIQWETSTARTSSRSTDDAASLSANAFVGFGAAIPATSPPAIAPATSTAPIETHQRIAALLSYGAMVTRKPAFEKQEHGLVLHIQFNQTALISPRPLLRCSMRISLRLAPGRRAPGLQASGRAVCARCRRCNEAIAKQPVSQQAGRLYSCAGNRKASGC